MDTPKDPKRNALGQFVNYAGPGRLTLAEHEAKKRAQLATEARKKAEAAERDAIEAAAQMIAARRPKPKDDVFVPGGQSRCAVLAGRRPIETSDKPKVRHHNPYDRLLDDEQS